MKPALTAEHDVGVVGQLVPAGAVGHVPATVLLDDPATGSPAAPAQRANSIAWLQTS